MRLAVATVALMVALMATRTAGAIEYKTGPWADPPRISPPPRVTELNKLSGAELDRECASRSPPAIGMSKGAAMMSTWGDKPITTNTTETTHGIREQWVYEASSCLLRSHEVSTLGWRGYLYFTNGILTAISKSGR